MADLTVAARPETRNEVRVYENPIIKTAITVVIGGYYDVEQSTGELIPPADAAGHVPKGLLLNFGRGAVDASGKIPPEVTGAAAAAGVIRPRARVLTGGFSIIGVPMGGAVSADQTDVGLDVFLYTSNIEADLTITVGSTDTRPKGVITEFLAVGSYVVRMSSADVISAL